MESQIGEDSTALQRESVSLATNDSTCCTSTNGLCLPLLSYQPCVPFSILPSYLRRTQRCAIFPPNGSTSISFLSLSSFFLLTAISLLNASGLLLPSPPRHFSSISPSAVHPHLWCPYLFTDLGEDLFLDILVPLRWSAFSFFIWKIH